MKAKSTLPSFALVLGQPLAAAIIPRYRAVLLAVCMTAATFASELRPAAAQTSAIACDQFARSYSQNASRQGQLLGGAATGSLLGLGLGALAGASGVGAAIGASVGLIGGGARRQATADQIYSAAYQDCRAGRIR